MTLNPMLYVCVISGFNVAELECCLQHRPSHLLLIVSEQASTQNNAQLFEQQIKISLPDICILRPDDWGKNSFDGASFEDTQRWVNTVLKPELSRHNLTKRCNITGGTKAITLALSDPSMGWDHIDYKGEGQKGLQVLRFDPQGRLQAQGNIALTKPASPQAVAKIHNSKVETRKINPLFEIPSSIQYAQNLWDGLTQKDEGLLSLFGNANTGFEKIWSYQRDQFNDSSVQFSAKEFVGTESFSPDSLIWLKQWHDLSPNDLKYDQNHIELPGNKGNNAFKRWLCGDWLEQLAAHWLRERIPHEQVATNLKINPLEGEKSSLGERETDIVVHYNELTSIIEIKTDLPPENKIRDLLDQILSFGDRIGRTNKILFIGPQLHHKILENNELETVTKSCKASSVKLAKNKEELLGFINR